MAVLVEHARRVGQQQQLFRFQNFGDAAGDNVSVDVVRLALFADTDRRDHRNECASFEVTDQAGVNLGDFANHADVNQISVIVAVMQHQFFGADHVAILASQANRLATCLVDQIDDVFVNLAAQHHLDDLHRLGVGDAHALNKLALLADTGEQILDLRPAAVHDDHIHADELEENNVARKTLFQILVDHGVAAEFDDDGFAVEAFDVGQCFGQDGRFLRRGEMWEGHGRVPCEDPRILLGGIANMKAH